MASLGTREYNAEDLPPYEKVLNSSLPPPLNANFDFKIIDLAPPYILPNPDRGHRGALKTQLRWKFTCDPGNLRLQILSPYDAYPAYLIDQEYGESPGIATATVQVNGSDPTLTNNP